MPALHAHFLLKNQQAFQRLLEASKQSVSSTGGGGSSNAPQLSSSGGRSWTRPGSLSALSGPPGGASACDVNERDWLGRTVLHLAVSSLDSSALEFVKLLLAHPRIDVNLADVESRWTALHRALYAGNLAACVLLLQRSDTDTSLKDFEGYTAFDLYNSTVEGTKPDLKDALDLSTWGANRNACLGLGDGNDRTYAEQVVVSANNPGIDMSKRSLTERFEPIRVRQVVMSKLHTTIVTNEKRANIRVCGFGSGGRLGLGQHTQYNPVPVPQLQTRITAVALGQDHTLALTENGDVLSWGMNRFSQLGYVIEAASSGATSGRSFSSTEEQIQLVPRRVIGPLKKEVVFGVAACRSASACWTESDLFTWGTNNGQLGYDKTAQAAQVLPRKIAAVDHVVDVAMTDFALACLLKSLDIICFWNGRHFKINFPTQIFPSEIQTYRPPMALNNASIAKIVCHEGSGTFAALSLNGEMFTFSLNAPPTSSDGATIDKHSIKPQRIWALRKQFSAVKDVALGADGTMILCTESGHVYVRTRNPKAGQSSNAKTFKFQRVPYLQRVVRVSANATGAFGALRADCKPAPIAFVGNTPAQDFANIRPFLTIPSPEIASENSSASPAQEVRSPVTDEGDVEDDAEDLEIREDVKTLQRLIEGIGGLSTQQEPGHDTDKFAPRLHGADLIVEVGSSQYPVHGVLLATRSPILKDVLLGQTVKEGKLTIALAPMSTKGARKLRSQRLDERHGESLPRMIFSGVHPLTVLIFLHFIYTDTLVSVWDRRIESPLVSQLVKLKASGQTIKSQLLMISRALGLKHLTAALDWHSRRAPSPSLDADISNLFYNTQERYSSAIVIPSDPLAPDTILQLLDKTVYCHSTILRARSAFFSGLFDDNDWTINRWNPNGTIEIDLRHMKWQVFDFAMRFIYGGEGVEMFDVLDFVGTVDNVLDFMFDVMAVASELLLDRLMLVCSSVILRHITILNVCSVVADATYYHANALVTSLQGYMARNMETLLESRMLDDLPGSLVKQLAAFVRTKQAEKLPSTRSRRLIDELMVKHAEWIALQDVPQPFVPNHTKAVHRLSPKVSPMASTRKGGKQTMTIAPMSSSPAIGVMRPPEVQRPTSAGAVVQGGDDIFQMDEIEKEAIPPLSLPPADVPAILQSGPARPWRIPASQAPAKSDFRTILAEAESTKIRPLASPGPFPVNRSASAGQGVLPPAASSPSSTMRSLNDRFKTRPSNEQDLSADSSQQRSSMPWRLPASSASPQPSTPQPSREMPRNTPPSGLSRIMREGPAASSSLSSPAQPQTPTKSDPKSKPVLGPTFTPTKSLAAGAPSVSRRTSEMSNAWTVNPSTPPEPELMTPSSSPPSFLAIQQQQLDRGKAPAKAKKSLREIQEEEQARQQEEDFMKWWAAEEQRMKAENSLSMQESAEGGKKANRSRKKPPFKGTMSKVSPATASVDVKDTTAHASNGTASTGVSRPQGPKHRRPRGRPSNSLAQ